MTKKEIPKQIKVKEGMNQTIDTKLEVLRLKINEILEYLEEEK